MSLASLLARGLEATVSASLSKLLRRVTGAGQVYRGNLVQSVIDLAIQAVESRLGALSGSDRYQTTRVIRATNAAQRLAIRMQNGTAGRLYPSDFTPLPGTSSTGAHEYTYKVVIFTDDGLGRRSNEVVYTFTSSNILSFDQVRAQAVQGLARANLSDDYRAQVPGLQSTTDVHVTLISAYRGRIDTY